MKKTPPQKNPTTLLNNATAAPVITAKDQIRDILHSIDSQMTDKIVSKKSGMILSQHVKLRKKLIEKALQIVEQINESSSNIFDKLLEVSQGYGTFNDLLQNITQNGELSLSDDKISDLVNLYFILIINQEVSQGPERDPIAKAKRLAVGLGIFFDSESVDITPNIRMIADYKGQLKHTNLLKYSQDLNRFLIKIFLNLMDIAIKKSAISFMDLNYYGREMTSILEERIGNFPEKIARELALDSTFQKLNTRYTDDRQTFEMRYNNLEAIFSMMESSIQKIKKNLPRKHADDLIRKLVNTLFYMNKLNEVYSLPDNRDTAQKEVQLMIANQICQKLKDLYPSSAALYKSDVKNASPLPRITTATNDMPENNAVEVPPIGNMAPIKDNNELPSASSMPIPTSSGIKGATQKQRNKSEIQVARIDTHEDLSAESSNIPISEDDETLTAEQEIGIRRNINKMEEEQAILEQQIGPVAATQIREEIKKINYQSYEFITFPGGNKPVVIEGNLVAIPQNLPPQQKNQLIKHLQNSHHSTIQRGILGNSKMQAAHNGEWIKVLVEQGGNSKEWLMGAFTELHGSKVMVFDHEIYSQTTKSHHVKEAKLQILSDRVRRRFERNMEDTDCREEIFSSLSALPAIPENKPSKQLSTRDM